MIDAFWWPVMIGGLLSGGSAATLGVYIVGMRIPFLAVCVSHAALAGAVFGSLLGLEGQLMMLPALGAAIAAALLLGLLEGRGVQLDANVVIGILFSLSMGLAFMGIGLFGKFGIPDNDVRSLLWGSLLFCQWADVRWMAIVALALGIFVIVFRKEMRAIMFSRLHASAAGVHVTLVWTTFLILTSAVLTVSFQTVGGLMIYSLITNPAVAAFLLAKGHDRALLLAIVLGAAISLLGFMTARWFDLPVGATIVILSSLLVAAAAVIANLRRRWQARAAEA